MGGKNSASFFQQTMQEVLGDLVYVSALIYIEDVLVYAEDFEQLMVAIKKSRFAFASIRHIFEAPQMYVFCYFNCLVWPLDK